MGLAPTSSSWRKACKAEQGPRTQQGLASQDQQLLQVVCLKLNPPIYAPATQPPRLQQGAVHFLGAGHVEQHHSCHRHREAQLDGQIACIRRCALQGSLGLQASGECEAQLDG